MFGQSPFLREVAAAPAHEGLQLLVEPLVVTRHLIVAHCAHPALTAFVNLK